MSKALEVTPTPTSKPVGGGDTAKSLRISGYPFSPFVNDRGETWVWEPAGMGAGYAGHWVPANQWNV
jgi:hypothetical protein